MVDTFCSDEPPTIPIFERHFLIKKYASPMETINAAIPKRANGSYALTSRVITLREIAINATSRTISECTTFSWR